MVETTNTSGTLSLNEVMSLTGYERGKINSLVAAGEFPEPLPLGPWTTGWSRSDIESWLTRHRKVL